MKAKSFLVLSKAGNSSTTLFSEPQDQEQCPDCDVHDENEHDGRRGLPRRHQLRGGQHLRPGTAEAAQGGSPGGQGQAGCAQGKG